MSTINRQTEDQVADLSTGIQGVDYVELYVGNVTQAAHYFRTAYGFTPIAYMGLETGSRDTTTVVLQQGTAFLLVTAPLQGSGPVAEYLQHHGDGVRDIALRVENVEAAFEASLRSGAQILQEPVVLGESPNRVVKATVTMYGDVVHSFIQREGRQESFLPGFQAHQPLAGSATGLHTIDHFAISLPAGELERWAQLYLQLGFHQLHEERIATEQSAIESVADSTEQVWFVLIEPVPGKRKSQIEEFLTFHQGLVCSIWPCTPKTSSRR